MISNLRAILVLSVLTLVVALATACGMDAKPPAPLASPLESSLSTPNIGGVLPTPSTSNTGTVGGIALRQTAGQPSYPLNGGALFLAEVQYYDNKPVMGVLDENTAPRAVVDERGFFVFTDVPPGKYVLIYATPMGSVVLNNPQTGTDMIIEIEGGEVIDLGELRYDIGF